MLTVNLNAQVRVYGTAFFSFLFLFFFEPQFHAGLNVSTPLSDSNLYFVDPHFQLHFEY